jgi:hypothetical protein
MARKSGKLATCTSRSKSLVWSQQHCRQRDKMHVCGLGTTAETQPTRWVVGLLDRNVLRALRGPRLRTQAFARSRGA